MDLNRELDSISGQERKPFYRFDHAKEDISATVLHNIGQLAHSPWRSPRRL